MAIDLTGPLYSSFEKAKNERKKALEAGDYEQAKEKALECARILRALAKQEPDKAKQHLENAEKWENASKEEPKKLGKARPIGKEGIEIEDDDFNKWLKGIKEYARSLKSKSTVGWQDIGGLEEVKKLMMENIVLAVIKKPPSIKPWRSVLLFGPPGTGKSLLASACAGSLKANFFNVEANKVLSKYFGESSRLISALYDVASEEAPSIVFVDEFDSISLSRSGDTSEAARKMLSTLLSSLDGFKDEKSELPVFTLAATNVPWDLDQAVLSRFPKRIYVPLPDAVACAQIIKIHTRGLESRVDLDEMAKRCVEKHLSGRDISTLCQGAILNMIREENKGLHELASKPFEEIKKLSVKTRPLTTNDFDEAFKKVKSPLTQKDIEKYEKWNEEFGG